MSARRRVAAAAAASVTVVAALSACSTTTETPAASTTAGGEVDKILFDFPFTALPIYGAMVGMVEDAADEAGVEVVFTDNADMSLTSQVSALTTHLNSDVDAVVSFPVDAASINSVARQYMDAGKIWVTYAGDLENQTSTLQFSFEESGRMLGRDAGEWALENLDGQGKVLILTSETVQIGQERTRGIIEGLRESAPDLEIIAQQDAVTPEEGLSVTNAILAQHPDVNIILAAAGDAAQGAYQAVLSSGRAADDAETYVGGLDGNLYLFQEMQSGNAVRGIVTVKSDEIADAVIQIPLAVGRGEEPETDVPVYLVTPDSPDLDEFIAAFGG